MDSIYTDFSNAFYKVCHRLLLDKMSTDTKPSRCQWLGSYFYGIESSGMKMSLIFRHVRVLLYADDMKLCLPVRVFRDCLKIQNDLNRLAEWCEVNAR
jgi:hypothetical protein